MIRLLSLSIVFLAAETAIGDQSQRGGLYEKLMLDRVVGVRILRLPKGDNAAEDVRTFVSRDVGHCETIDKNLRLLPVSGPVRITTGPIPKWEVVRRVVFINSDGREVSLSVYNDHLQRSFANAGPAGQIIATLKTIEDETERELEEKRRLPVIDAVVTHAAAMQFPNAGAGLIRKHDRVTIDLNKLAESKLSSRLHFSSESEPQRRGWLAFPSAMSCQGVDTTYRGKLRDAGYRLYSQHYNTDDLTRIDVLAFRREQGGVRYEISIMHEQNTFVRGFIRLTGRPAENDDRAESQDDAE